MRVQKTIIVRPLCFANYTLAYISFSHGWKRSLFTGQRLDFAMKVFDFPMSAEYRGKHLNTWEKPCTWVKELWEGK